MRRTRYAESGADPACSGGAAGCRRAGSPLLCVGLFEKRRKSDWDMSRRPSHLRLENGATNGGERKVCEYALGEALHARVSASAFDQFALVSAPAESRGAAAGERFNPCACRVTMPQVQGSRMHPGVLIRHALGNKNRRQNHRVPIATAMEGPPGRARRCDDGARCEPCNNLQEFSARPLVHVQF